MAKIGPDPIWQALTNAGLAHMVRSVDLSAAYVPYEPEAWRDALNGLESVSFTMSGVFDADDDPFAALWDWLAWAKRRRVCRMHRAYRQRSLARRRRNR